MNETILTSVQLVFVLVALIIGIRQVWEARRARSIDAFLTISAELNTTEAREARHFIFTQIPALQPEDLSWSQRDIVIRASVSYDRLGVLVLKGLLPEDVALAMYFDSVIKTWESAEKVINWERKTRGYDSHLYHFEELYKRCKQYAKKRGILNIKVYPDEPKDSSVLVVENNTEAKVSLHPA